MPTKTTTYENQQDVEMQCVRLKGRLTVRVITKGLHFGKGVRITKDDRTLGQLYAARVYTIYRNGGIDNDHAGIMGDYYNYTKIDTSILPRGDE